MSKVLRIGILAGESSGDILGAGLMLVLKSQHPQVIFEGIGGPLMSAQGLQSMVPMESLSVMGLIEPLKRLPELLRVRKKIVKHFLDNEPDVFIGIDSPDFNLNIEKQLKLSGIPIVHYVSPSVWAWRSKRIHKIARSVDLMLTLFPFEEAIYEKNGIAVSCVGHPLADLIPIEIDKISAVQGLGLKQDTPIMALLPGSREGEVGRLAPEFLECASLCMQHDSELQIVIPCANAARRQQIEVLLFDKFPTLNITMVDGQSREVMAAADVILIASGTATLEALLLKKPMLVCYKMSALSYAFISRMLKVPYFSLPNLLAGKVLVEEKVQSEVNAEALFHGIQALFQDKNKQVELNLEYLKIHRLLRKNANARAAEAVLNLITQGRKL
ncbi:MAG: lipid-A-disaccharide synthase [Gammaproteobacteria bacterium]|jgi:lipid-A-disaccharide synthase|nr:lipid-A-disaccharide synthase [Gammaproteobacteria bacterium]